MSPHELRLGTRGSPLALWQAREVARRIGEEGGPPCRIVIIKTSGDQLQDAPLSAIGGKRLFVKEIEEALLRREIDLAVHSAKDMPAVLPSGLVVAAVLPREDPRDAVVLPMAPGGAQTGTALANVQTLLATLGQAPRIGTGSVRRIAQLTRLLPGARFTSIRGNLDTRLRKLDAGDYDALVLAAAGLRRLGFQSRISLALPAATCIPAPGQGIVAIETRQDADAVRTIAAAINDASAGTALVAERALVEALGGGCQIPVGGVASIQHEDIEFIGIVVSLDGNRAVRAHGHGKCHEAAAIGARVGAMLIADGAEDILAEARRAQATLQSHQPPKVV